MTATSPWIMPCCGRHNSRTFVVAGIASMGGTDRCGALRPVAGGEGTGTRMHPLLEQTAGKLKQHFRADDRCLAIYLWGSSGRVTDDLYSDLDLGVVGRDGELDAVKAELRSICERVCGPIQGW